MQETCTVGKRLLQRAETAVSFYEIARQMPSQLILDTKHCDVDNMKVDA